MPTMENPSDTIHDAFLSSFGCFFDLVYLPFFNQATGRFPLSAYFSGREVVFSNPFKHRTACTGFRILTRLQRALFWDLQLIKGSIPAVSGRDTHEHKGIQSLLFNIGNPTTWVYSKNKSGEMGSFWRGRQD